MYNYPPAMQNAPLSSYMGGGAPQPTQASRPSTMHGSVPFRAGDWKCGAEGCGYHNFAKNVSCLRCGASRAQAALIADSTGGLSTPASMSSMGSIYSTPSHHTSDSHGSSVFSSGQYPPSSGYPTPLGPANALPSQNYPPLGAGGYSGHQGMGNNIGGMGMGSGRGGPQMESGDWTCLSCGYVNFRRRNNCLRCNNFNPNLVGGGMGPGPMSRPAPPPSQSQSGAAPPHLSMLDTTIVESFLNDDGDRAPSHSRMPQSAGPIPSTSFLTRSMNNLSLGPLTTQYGRGDGGYGTIGGGPLTAPPLGVDDDYEYGSRSTSAIDRLGVFGSYRHGQRGGNED